MVHQDSLPYQRIKSTAQNVLRSKLFDVLGVETIFSQAMLLHSTHQSPNLRLQNTAIEYKKEPHIQLVGCLRPGCSDSGMDRAGFWIMPGKVQRALSPVEMVSTLENDEVLIINDLHDISKAVLIED